MKLRALALVLALVAAMPAEARLLKGRLFLGRDLSICLQEDESLVTDLLRLISLVRSEVPVVNLSAAAITPDQLAIGTDHQIYAADGQGAWVQVGEAPDYSELKLADGVTVSLNREVSGAFAGDATERLVVRWTGTRDKVEKPPLAKLADWLAELDRLGADLSPRKAPPATYVFLFNAIASSMPTDGTGNPEHFRTLKTWIESGSWTAKAPLESLLKRIKKDTQAHLVGATGYGEPTSDAGRLMQAYEALEKALSEKQP